MIRIRNTPLMDWAVYLTLIIFIGTGLVVLPSASDRAIISVSLIAFGLAYTFGYRVGVTQRSINVYVAIQTALTGGLMLRFPTADLFSFLLFILVIQVTLALPVQISARWVALLFLLEGLRLYLIGSPDKFVNILLNMPIYLIVSIFGYTIRQAEIARREKELLFEELQKTQSQLRELAVMEERTRLARELHDSLGHRLTVAVVQLEGAQRLIPTKPEQASDMIATMRDELKNALAELRSTVSAMRSPVTDNQPLESALLTLCESFQHNTRLATHFIPAQNFPALPESYRLAFYRAAQEGLTNIQRHADAQNAWIRIDVDDTNLTLIVEDDGKGFESQSQNNHGTGLIGLKERAEGLGGGLQVSQRTGGGMQLSFIVPMPERSIHD